MEAAVYVSSDDVDVEAWGHSKVYLPHLGADGAAAQVRMNNDSEVIRGVETPGAASN